MNPQEQENVTDAVVKDDGGKIKYTGVRKRASGKYGAEIYDRRKKSKVWLGTFVKEEDAARAYDSAAKKLHGSNAKTNFPLAGDGGSTSVTPINSTVSASVTPVNSTISVTESETTSSSGSDQDVLSPAASDLSKVPVRLEPNDVDLGLQIAVEVDPEASSAVDCKLDLDLKLGR